MEKIRIAPESATGARYPSFHLWQGCRWIKLTPVSRQTPNEPGSSHPRSPLPILKILLIVVIVLAIALVAFLIYVQSQPSRISYERSVRVNAPATTVFAHVNDFHQWEAWSPWEKVDPNVQRTYGGSASGEGAWYEWKGNRNVGAGRLTIAKSVPHERIELKMEFFAPMAATNIGTFTFQAQGNETLVTQTMACEPPFFGKLFGVFIDMDKMIGSQFEKGLQDLKGIAEAGARVAS
jgi:hypothetical protein